MIDSCLNRYKFTTLNCKCRNTANRSKKFSIAKSQQTIMISLIQQFRVLQTFLTRTFIIQSLRQRHSHAIVYNVE